jgi:hypothetical protein
VPFLRVLRDRRGYETTYLMDLFREGSRQRSRVLYVFRTPAGVRVGRGALDRGVLREIEQRYPDVAFDWDAVREHQQVIDSAPDLRRRRPRREDRDAPPPAVAVQSPPAAPEPERAEAPPKPAIPSALEGETPDEHIAFLQRWYPVIRDRIAQRTTDPLRRDALGALAERLNPSAWTDADTITSGLAQAAEALDRLSRVLTRRRRRARKRPAAPGEAPSPEAAVAPTSDPEIPESEEDEASSGAEEDEFEA